ncbi:hypothetical protein IP69_08845 [Bosea sp. AAP35]|uniref:hypothetical protein n=1 Tax=Bosea sp. AAP35 TaxID=1523417 RepID=UPI0006B8A67C|nr:hypothetical protein [Bosea sp. AAP35]KPF70837.1 hypothetical protein IP69_08845 [Bosea sp. AAP35]
MRNSPGRDRADSSAFRHRSRPRARYYLAERNRAPDCRWRTLTGIVFLQFYNILADSLGLDLVGRFWGLILAHIFFCTPYAIGAVGSVITTDLDRNENAARIAGTTEWRV